VKVIDFRVIFGSKIFRNLLIYIYFGCGNGTGHTNLVSFDVMKFCRANLVEMEMLEAPVSGEGKSRIVAAIAAQEARPSSDRRIVFLQFHQRFRMIFDNQFLL